MKRRVSIPALCACQRLAPRPGQRDCRLCHAEDMRARRAAAKARGTYTLAGVNPPYTNLDGDPEVEARRLARLHAIEWPRIETRIVSRGMSRRPWNEKPCARACGRLRDLPYTAYCSACRREYMRQARRRHAELTPLQRKKANCRTYTATLIRRGRIVPQPCEVCGAIKVQAHHPDYDNPRLVRWLCDEHHRALHVAGQAESPAPVPTDVEAAR